MKNKLTISVVIVTFLYIIIGGVIFQVLEETNDDQQRQLIESTLSSYFNRSDDNFSREDVDEIIATTMKAISYGINVTLVDDGVPSTPNWDLYSSVFFAVTVVTTIGYGNSPLKTPNGRTFCVFYAIAGVPLCVVTLFLIGQQEKTFIYFITRKMALCFRQDKRKHHWFSTILVSVGGSIVFIYLSAVVFMVIEGWSYMDAIYFCLITLLTIGFGDYVAGWSYNSKLWYRLLIGVWIMFGLSWCTILISACQDLYMDLFEKTSKVAEMIELSVKSKVENLSEELSKNGHSSNDHGHSSTDRHQVAATTSKRVSPTEAKRSEKKSPTSETA